MTAKTSAEMCEALRLVMSGLTGREAARQAGVREESLYRRVEYKEWRLKSKALSESSDATSLTSVQVRRMQAALDVPSTLIPNGLSLEEMRAFILANTQPKPR